MKTRFVQVLILNNIQASLNFKTIRLHFIPKIAEFPIEIKPNPAFI